MNQAGTLKIPSFFICGTDTGVGKTVITGLTAHYLLKKGRQIITQKWIQTGTESASDIDVHLRFMGKKDTEVAAISNELVPYSLKLPASPHLAAKQENLEIEPQKIINSFNHLAEKYEAVLVEGIGGVLVPYSSERLVLDIVAQLKLPVLIVAQNKLGAVNHTLLTIEAVKKRSLKIIGIIYNSHANGGEPQILADNPKIITKLSGIPSLGLLPWEDDPDRLIESFDVIGRNLMRVING